MAKHPPDALRREIKEETALDVQDIVFVMVQDCIHSREFYRDAHFVLLNYTCRCVGEPKVRLNEEAQEFQWLSLDAAFQLPLNQPTRILLEACPSTNLSISALSMDKIIIADLEVFYHVGVTEQERSKPQRLLLSIEMLHDFKAAVASDNLEGTINYFSVSQRLLHFGDGAQWQLIETLAQHIAEMILRDYKPSAVTVEVKKFVIPQARHVAVSLTRSR